MEFTMNPYIVYVKVNSNSYITAVDSSAFLTDLTDWVKIDEGYGDKYHHAQGKYFDRPVMTMGGAYRYKLADGAVVECTAEEIAQQEAANRPVPVVPESDTAIWDELAAAITEGVDDV